MKTKNKTKTIAVGIVLLCLPGFLLARENQGSNGSNTPKNAPSALVAGCSATTTQNDLDINNVRTTILVGGDMWWDLSNPKYEVPINSGKHSIFAGALWIGGVDQSNQVLTACQTYRQTGNDFWGGPINITSTSITSDRCLAFDKHFVITKEEVENFVEDPSTVTNVIKNWPGNGNASNPTEGQFLAPFFDAAGDGVYDYTAGDYPGYSLDGEYPEVPIPNTLLTKVECTDYLFGDKTLWWVFNDVGNAHTETSSQPVGIEVRAQAFAFKSNDEINDMTFYQYQVINRSSSSLNNTYFGQWVDPDLGNATDDYVGCDVPRGLGFCYNGDADDDGAGGYGPNPPAVGVDFFQGPVADLNDNVDNDRDGCVDCTFLLDANNNTVQVNDEDLPEKIIMSKFVYYNNFNNTPDGNPDGFTDFYNYLRGIWLDNLPMTYGGDGRDPNAPLCNFMFPGDTDPDFPGTPWTEVTAGNPPEDRRFIQSAGAFTLASGAVNYITTGVVWARADAGGPEASVDLAKLADDKAQALFDNCFKLLDGPDAPDIAIRELDRSIIISLENTETSKVELYDQVDPTIVGWTDNRYRFQGYQIYQLKYNNVSSSEFNDPNKARLLLQCDIRDSISQIVNFDFDPSLNAAVPVEMVNGNNEGIVHSFKVSTDLFATGGTQLVNHKTYFYAAVSYAFNQYKKYDPNSPTGLDGQQKPYKAGRKNIKAYSAVPHAPEVEWNGQILNSEFGDGPQIKRIEGQGNGGMVLDMTTGSINEILTNGITLNPVYQNAHGPIDIKVYDPVQVQSGNFELKFDSVSSAALWRITEFNSNITDVADRSIGTENEQILKRKGEDGLSDYSWGISANIHNVIEAGKTGAVNNGFLEGTIQYSDNSNRWLNSLKDIDGLTPENWIRSGVNGLNPADVPGDLQQAYESVIDGTWAPFKQTANDSTGPKPGSDGIAEGQITLSPGTVTKTSIASVDIVITSDPTYWTRVPVIELGYYLATVQDSAKRFNLRKAPSVDKQGRPYNDPNANLSEATLVSDSGMSWFPGYAYNLETGERLNMAFGENSSLIADNGRDMIWNPSTRKYDANDIPVFGGMHYIYVFGHNGNTATDIPMYDQGRVIFNKLDSAKIGGTTGQNHRRAVYKDCMWASIPIRTEGKDLLSSRVDIRLRVARTYRRYNTNTDQSTWLTSANTLSPGISYYVNSGTATYGGFNYAEGNFFVANSTIGPNFTGTGVVVPTQNGANPMYTFSTDDLTSIKNDVETAKSALDLINVVPNPYYAYSAYQGYSAIDPSINGQLDNRIKIVNIPNRCTVTIFNLNGTLVRKFVHDTGDDNSEGKDANDLKDPNLETSLDWDLKNHKGVTIGSGIYLIHVDAEGLGERTIKWFGVIRPIDLSTF